MSLGEPDPDTIPDKRAYEQAIAEALAKMLRTFDPGLGEHDMTLVGSYPDTILRVSGPNIRTRQPDSWELAVWDFWQEWGNVNGTVTVLYAQLAA